VRTKLSDLGDEFRATQQGVSVNPEARNASSTRLFVQGSGRKEKPPESANLGHDSGTKETQADHRFTQALCNAVAPEKEEKNPPLAHKWLPSKVEEEKCPPIHFCENPDRAVEICRHIMRRSERSQPLTKKWVLCFLALRVKEQEEAWEHPVPGFPWNEKRRMSPIGAEKISQNKLYYGGERGK